MIDVMDVIEWSKAWKGEPFHAVLCDPPYHLGSDGFMGEEWDRGDIAFNPETWRGLYNNLYPGGFLLAFSGSYNYDLMAYAIRQAGFQIYPMLAWVHAQGMGLGRRIDGFPDYRYGMQALKPAIEPIVCAMKPTELPIKEVIRLYGTGALGVENVSVGDEKRVNSPARNKPGGVAYMLSRNGANASEPRERVGRYPSNVIFDQEALASVMNECGKSLEEIYHVVPWMASVAINITVNHAVVYASKASRKERDLGLDEMEITDAGVFYGRRDGTLGKVTRGRNTHPTVKPIKLTRTLAKLILPPESAGTRRLLVPFSGSGSEIIGAYLAGWEEVQGVELMSHYAVMSKARIRAHTGREEVLR